MVPAPKQLALLVSAIAIGWACPDRALAAIAPGDATSPPGPIGGSRPSSDWLRQFACASIAADEVEAALAAHTAAAPASMAIADAPAATHRAAGSRAPATSSACAQPSVDRVHASAVASPAVAAWFDDVPSIDAAGRREPRPGPPPSPPEPSPPAPPNAVPLRPSAHPAAASSALVLEGGEPEAGADVSAADGSSTGDEEAPSSAGHDMPPHPAPGDGFGPTGTSSLPGATRSEILAWEMFVAGASAGSADDPGQADAPEHTHIDAVVHRVAPAETASGSARVVAPQRPSLQRAAAPVESDRSDVTAAVTPATRHAKSSHRPTTSEAATAAMTFTSLPGRPTSRTDPVVPGDVPMADAGARALVPRPAGAPSHSRAAPECDDGGAADALQLYERAQRGASGVACMSAGLAPLSPASGAPATGARPDSVTSAPPFVVVEHVDRAPASRQHGAAAVAPVTPGVVDTAHSRPTPAATARDVADRAGAAAVADIVVADHASRVLMSLEALLTCDDEPHGRFGAQTREVVVANHSEKVLRTLQDVLTRAKLRALEQRRSVSAAGQRRVNPSPATPPGCRSPGLAWSAAGGAPTPGSAPAVAAEVRNLRPDCQEASRAGVPTPPSPVGRQVVAGADGAPPPGSLRWPGCAAEPTPVHARGPAGGAPAAPGDAGAATGALTPSAEVVTIGGRPALDEADLDTVRGGFTTDSGLKISFGIERAVYVNGNLVATTSLTVSELGRISGGRAVPDVGADAMMLIRNGAGNVTRLGDMGGAVATIIQNTLNNQNISNLTVIDATVNSLQLSRGMDLHSTLRNAVTDALRR